MPNPGQRPDFGADPPTPPPWRMDREVPTTPPPAGYEPEVLSSRPPRGASRSTLCPLMTLAELRDLPLDPSAAYVFGLIDGPTRREEVVEASVLGQRETDRVLDELLDLGALAEQAGAR